MNAPGVTLTERSALALAFITVRQSRSAVLAAQSGKLIGVTFPVDRRVTGNSSLSLIDCGDRRYLAVAETSDAGKLAQEMQQRLAGLAAVVDYSDQFFVMSLAGVSAPRVLANLCSIDVSPSAFPSGAAAVTRLGDVRATLWTTDEPGAYGIAVQRSLARHCWEAIVESAGDTE